MQRARKLNCLNCGAFGHNTLDCPEWAIPELTPEEEEACARHRHALDEQVEQLWLQRLKREREEIQLAATMAATVASQTVSNATADTINPNANSARPTEPAGTSCNPKDEPYRMADENLWGEGQLDNGDVETAGKTEGSETAEVASGQGAGARCPGEGATDKSAHGDGAITDSQGASGDAKVDRVCAPPTKTCDHNKSQSTSNAVTHPVTTSASACSASHDHPATTNDDTSTTGDPETVDESTWTSVIRPPNAPVERPRPPDSADDEVQRARVVEVEVSRVSDEVEAVAETNGDEECQPERPVKPPDGAEEGARPLGTAHDVARRPEAVEVEPGGIGDVGRHGSTELERTDAGSGCGIGGASPDAGIEGETAVTRPDETMEVVCASATERERPIAADEDNDQRTSRIGHDVPRLPLEPPKPPDRPLERPQREEEPPSVELEGERSGFASCDEACRAVEADVSGLSDGDDDPRNRPKGLQDASEHAHGRVGRQVERNSPRPTRDKPGDPEREADASRASSGDEDPCKVPKKPTEAREQVGERMERQVQENAPERTPDGPDEPGRNTAMPDDLPSTRESSQSHGNDGVDETSAPSRGIGPGGAEGELGELGDGECDRTRDSDGDDVHSTQGCPRGDGDERKVETAAPGRDIGRGDRVEVQDRSDDVEGDQGHKNDGDGDGYDGTRDRMDGSTSCARRESKRLRTRWLAIEQQGQRGRHDHNTAHVTGPSTASTDNPRRPIAQPNPPRRRGRLKRDLEALVGRDRLTEPSGHVQLKSGESDVPDALYIDWRWCWINPEAGDGEDNELEAIWYPT